MLRLHVIHTRSSHLCRTSSCLSVCFPRPLVNPTLELPLRSGGIVTPRRQRRRQFPRSIRCYRAHVDDVSQIEIDKTSSSWAAAAAAATGAAVTSTNHLQPYHDTSTSTFTSTKVDVGDPYRTRVSTPLSPILRPDPVVWTHSSFNNNKTTTITTTNTSQSSNPDSSSSSNPLSHASLASYRKNGFLRIPSLLTPSQVLALNTEIDALISPPSSSSTSSSKPSLSRGDPRIIYEPSSSSSSSSSNSKIRSLFEIHRLSRTLHSLLHLVDSPITTLATQILSSPVYMHQSRVNFKPSFHGKGFFWHSDFETWHADDGMPAPRALSVSIALSENRTSNGPLMLIPGSQRWFVPCVGETPGGHFKDSLREQRVGVPTEEGVSWLVERGRSRSQSCRADRDGKEGIEVITGPPGSAVIFDSNCMHASCDNVSPWERRNLFVVFNSVANTLREPFYARERRPEFIAARDFRPI